MSETVFGMERSHFVFFTAKDYFDKEYAATKEVHPFEFTFDTKFVGK
jgi:hypothetical protein